MWRSKLFWLKKQMLISKVKQLFCLTLFLIWTLISPIATTSETEALSDEIDPSLEVLPAAEAHQIINSQATALPTLKDAAPKEALSTETDQQETLKPQDTSQAQQHDQSEKTLEEPTTLIKDPTTTKSVDTNASKTTTTDGIPSPSTANQETASDDTNKNKAEDQTPAAPVQKPLYLLGTEIPPGLATRVAWRPGHSLKGLASQAPVLVVHGKKPGPTLCITAAVHGDELNGIEVVRQVLHKVKANKLRGTLIGVPIVNIQGFLRNSRYLVDRRDLNRFFPGTPHGSLASRIAYSFFNQVILNCSALVDVHTGSFYRDNIPQLRADLALPSVVQMTEGFGSTLVLHSSGAHGTLRKAAVTYNIPAVTLELGGPMILDESAVEHGVEGIFNLLDSLDMYTKNSFWGTPKPVYYQSRWVRAENGGIFFSRVKLGTHISPGDTLGTITNPITNEQFILTSPLEGEVVGLAHNQMVYPGFATVHLAIKPTEKAPVNPPKAQPEPEDINELDVMEKDE